jgi:glycine dehydrogenase
MSSFLARHLGSDPAEESAMLEAVGARTMEDLIARTVPAGIRLGRPLDLPVPVGEAEALAELAELAARNRVVRSHIGMGYQACVTPGVIQRNILENPGWYTQYTPYQAEIAQGRLEALLNYQTLVADLTGLDVANASLLDEPTAAAEAMSMALRLRDEPGRDHFFVADTCHPQTLAVVRARAEPLGITIVTGDPATTTPDATWFGALVQYPDTFGAVVDPSAFFDAVRSAGALAICATDLLALTLLRPPGECGADIAVGSAQRFGVPMGFGGPHAAFMAVRDAHKRQMPGRLIGLSRDAAGNPALRLALQTREQHIRRDKATSNICTAQVLLAVMASMYAVYHGPDGLRAIARRVRSGALELADRLRRAGLRVGDAPFFDTLSVEGVDADAVLAAGVQQGINLRRIDAGRVGIALDETTADLGPILRAFGIDAVGAVPVEERPDAGFDAPLARISDFLTHPVFHAHRTETELLRYIRKLESRDLSLTTSMIPLGSCTMKLNATAEMLPVSWPEFAHLHPFAPEDQTAGYRALFAQLERWLAEITGFAAVSLQPNAGSQGEYAGLLVIRAWHRSRGDQPAAMSA